jgi:hypothetical protein
MVSWVRIIHMIIFRFESLAFAEDNTGRLVVLTKNGHLVENFGWAEKEIHNISIQSLSRADFITNFDSIKIFE